MHEEKSHVSLGERMCVVCTRLYAAEILLDRRLKSTLPPKTAMGYGYCPKCQDLRDRGMVALVGVDPEKSTVAPGDMLQPKDAYRTGTILHLKRDVFRETFSTEPPDGGVVFIADEAIKRLLAIYQAHVGEAPPDSGLALTQEEERERDASPHVRREA